MQRSTDFLAISAITWPSIGRTDEGLQALGAVRESDFLAVSAFSAAPLQVCADPCLPITGHRADAAPRGDARRP